MKLASLKHGRDGKLVVVSSDLSRCVNAMVPTLQAALDDWSACSASLITLYNQLESGAIPGEAFVPESCASP